MFFYFQLKNKVITAELMNAIYWNESD